MDLDPTDTENALEETNEKRADSLVLPTKKTKTKTKTI